MTTLFRVCACLLIAGALGGWMLENMAFGIGCAVAAIVLILYHLGD